MIVMLKELKRLSSKENSRVVFLRCNSKMEWWFISKAFFAEAYFNTLNLLLNKKVGIKND
jgi:hypothetical protein